jgi:DNA-binding NarL/FixJ family response regulator
MTIRILIADRDPDHCKRLSDRLSRDADLSVIARAETLEDIVDAVARDPIDVAVIDPSLPGCGGFELIRELKALRPSIKTLMRTTRSNRTVVMRALHAGADGYMERSWESGDVAAAIRQVASGHAYVCPHVGHLIAMSILPRSTAGYRHLPM